MALCSIPASLFIATALPHAARDAEVFIDFDGTLSRQDVIDQLGLLYAPVEPWKELEQRWERGEIGSKACLAGQLALLDVTKGELGQFLDSVQLDAGATALLRFLRRRRVPVTVLSDGIDVFINRILRRHGVRGLDVRCNSMSFTPPGRILLRTPFESADCANSAAHCKCASAKAQRRPGRKIIYIGDGRSDLCVSRNADVVFAKKVLARCLTQEQRQFIPFETLSDVERVLAAAWPGPSIKRRFSPALAI